MLDARQGILRLVELTQSAKSMQIFIGAENQLFNLSGCAMIVAPYTAGAEGGRDSTVVGAIGVIGPTRMNYARIIPLVDYTARVVSRLLGSPDTENRR
jgi:heat-inducible transcriptional repressor